MIDGTEREDAGASGTHRLDLPELPTEALAIEPRGKIISKTF